MSVVLLRAAAVLLAAFWAVIFFGLIDLSVPFDAANRQEFSAELMLDTGWGIFVTVLVAAPLLVWSVRPNRFTTAAHLAVTAACFALAGLAGQVANFPLPVVGLLLSAAVVGPLGQRAARSAYEDPGIPPRWQLDRPTLVLTLLAAGPAVWVSVLLIGSMPDPRDDVTLGLPHLPVQAALALAIPALAAVGCLRMPGWRTTTWTASCAALWWGALSLWYPSRLGTLGLAGGVAAIVWAVLLTLSALPVLGDQRASASTVPAGG
jgi:hypothetical protein